jgi:4-hydroxy-tetrahydrodipicolinate reductase
MKRNKVNVVLYGLGPLGKQVARAILSRSQMVIVGAIDLQGVGADLGEILELDETTGVSVSDNAKQVLSDTKPDAVIHMTSSSLEVIRPQLEECADAGANVVTSCEQLSYPFRTKGALVREIDRCFAKAGATLLGTGINPGYLMDKLPLLLSAVMLNIDAVRVTRMMYSRVRRPSFQKKIGTGMGEREFRQLIADKVITGHVGLFESAAMIVAGLGWEVDEIEELPVEPIICDQEVTTYTNPTKQTELMTVKPGQVGGLRNVVIAKRDDAPVVTLDFIAHANVEEGYDLIELDGVPNIRVKNLDGMDGDIGTTAILINCVRTVIDSSPGLLTMKDVNLPVPFHTNL